MIALAALLITVAIGAAMVASHDLQRRREELQRLEVASDEAHRRLREAQRQTRTTLDSSELLKKIRQETRSRIDQRRIEIDELSEDLAHARQIKTPLTNRREREHSEPDRDIAVPESSQGGLDRSP